MKICGEENNSAQCVFPQKPCLCSASFTRMDRQSNSAPALPEEFATLLTFSFRLDRAPKPQKTLHFGENFL